MMLEIGDWCPRPRARPPADEWLNLWNRFGDFTGWLPDIRYSSD